MKTKYVALIMTIIFVSLLITTTVMDQYKSNWLCGAALQVVGYPLIIIQSILTAIVFSAKREPTKGVLTTVIAIMTLLYSVGFINFMSGFN